jgi:hypothetical protein
MPPILSTTNYLNARFKIIVARLAAEVFFDFHCRLVVFDMFYKDFVCRKTLVAIWAWLKPRIAQVFLVKVEVVFSRESFFAGIASEFHWRMFGT